MKNYGTKLVTIEKWTLFTADKEELDVFEDESEATAALTDLNYHNALEDEPLAYLEHSEEEKEIEDEGPDPDEAFERMREDRYFNED